MANLRKLRDMASGLGQVGAAIQAETNVGKVDGFYIERKIEATSSLEELVAGSYGAARDETPKHSSGQPVKALARKRKKR